MSFLHFFTTALIIFTIFNPTLTCFTSIINFGDSLSDTGNYLFSKSKVDIVGRFPYGETYFHEPTGRFSDGRIILDFLAEAMGIPYVPPFLGRLNGWKFEHGMNFAVGGATAIESYFFWEKGIDLSTNYSLSVQIKWFKEMLSSLCPSDFADCNAIFSKSIFFVGEIGGNDYNVPLSNGITLDEIKKYVPRVIDSISSAIDELINLGAKTIVVPGYLPVGCLSGFLTIFETSSNDDYDHAGCIKWLNTFAEYHDQKLLEELSHLRHQHPSTTIIYADYYNAVMNIYSNPHQFGFGEKYLSACCGGGGPYNFNNSAICGSGSGSGSGTVNVCDDPSIYICWDGLHLTEAAYRAIASQLINGSLSIAPINNACQITFI